MFDFGDFRAVGGQRYHMLLNNLHLKVYMQENIYEYICITLQLGGSSRVQHAATGSGNHVPTRRRIYLRG